ncbi:N-acetylmuramoyl-L-alanine amidase [Candidatus Tisiphia endosymbiont of Beris chalybata]|uniref:N-acetylmuramoyl-L-alanine amidase n=1 Tax=Candidatus Tisiphia endosymbiont of Beris chalybata TaxID=3066262 RepID=UPI00312C81BB
MTKYSPPHGPEISKEFLRNNPEFSLDSPAELTNLEFGKCNYYTDRKETSLLQYIIQTCSFASFDATLAKMCLSDGGNIQELKNNASSVHYIIDKDGSIYQLVSDNKKTWAVKGGELKTGSILNPNIPNDLKDDEMNHVSINIMSINTGSEPFPLIQVEQNISLCNYLTFTHHIDQRNVIALSDCEVGSCLAPGPYFPWNKFAQHAIGRWSNIARKDNPDIIISHLPYNQVVPSHPEELLTLVEKFQKLGILTDDYMVDSNNYPQLQDSMLKFNLHHLGPQIIEHPERKQLYDAILSKNPTEPYAKARLARWDENSSNILDDLIGITKMGEPTLWDASNHMAFC